MNTSDERRRLVLAVGALGVVYGDIGTSPLYALRECFTGSHGVALAAENVFGVVSLIVWSLVLMVSVKYLGWVVRAHNKGEGGILALLSLALPERAGKLRRSAGGLLVVGLFGATLLYGDGMLTPALTVLGAIEGLGVTAPVFRPYVVPLAVVVLVGLFSVQRFGTGKVGSVFGPIMVVWFLTLAVLGLRGIWMAPRILEGLSPHHAVLFLFRNGSQAFMVLGAVFLAVTGAEALYADLGHFGAGPIRRAWFAVAFPALVLNYLGEGGLLLLDPEAAENPFYYLAPSWAMPLLVVLATLAAVIASQAVISGTYSLTMQAIQMGYLPRLIIRHTSHAERGQIYMPQVNRFLLLACVGLVLGFQSSSRLAGAYGIAVSLTMLVTTILFYSAARRLWGWSVGGGLLLCAGFLGIETCFVVANALKVWQGGWFPLLMAAGIFALMTTWRTGRQSLRVRLNESYLPLDLFLKDLESRPITRVKGTAVFLSGNPGGTPISLLHNLRHNKVLHERVVILTALTEDIPYVAESARVTVERLRSDIYRVVGRYGFMEQPNVPALLGACAAQGLEMEDMQTTFFLSRETILPSKGPGMAQWRRRLFATMSRNAQAASAFFQLPPNRVIELGLQVEV